MTELSTLTAENDDTIKLFERFIAAENSDIENMSCATFAEYMLGLNPDDPESERRYIDDELELDEIGGNIFSNTILTQQTFQFDSEKAANSDVVALMWSFDIKIDGVPYYFGFHAGHFMIPEKASLGKRVFQRSGISAETQHIPADAAIEKFLEESKTLLYNQAGSHPENLSVIFQYRVRKM